MAKKDVTTGTCNSLLKLSSNAIQQIEHLSKKFPLNIKEKQELQPKTERSTVTFDTGWYQDAGVIMSYMPTLPDYPGVSRMRQQSPGLPYGSPNLPDKIKL